MPLQIIRNDITKLRCDAIVNAANSTLLGGGGVDGAIHKAAGKGLLLECMKLGGCKVGHAKLTGAYKLPCRYVIHTVGPRWRGGQNGERELLESCYRESLRLAMDHGCESVAFPLISSGIYGYPKDQALRVAVDMITSFLMEHDMLVYLVIFDKAAFRISEKLFTDITSYIDDKYVDTHFEFTQFQRDEQGESTLLAETCILPDMGEIQEPPTPLVPYPQETSTPRTAPIPQATSTPQATPTLQTASIPKTVPIPQATSIPKAVPIPKAASLEDAVKQMDESFSEMLLRKIDEKGMTDSQCYKKANVDRKLFSKIRSDNHYHPSKTTAIAFAIALELDLEETKDMLMKAGFALSHSNKFDIIIEYFITNENYNVFEINEALFAFDQTILGGR